MLPLNQATQLQQPPAQNYMMQPSQQFMPAAQQAVHNNAGMVQPQMGSNLMPPQPQFSQLQSQMQQVQQIDMSQHKQLMEEQ